MFQLNLKIDRLAQVAMLQLAIMNHRRIMLDDKVQARRRRRVKRFGIRPWLAADRRLQFGHYDQLIRALRMEDSSSFFNYMRMEPLMFDEIPNRVGQIYPTEIQLNKVNSSDTEATFLDLNLSITNGIVSSKIYDKRDDLNFEIVNFPFRDGDVPRSPSYGVYISQLIRFARVCSNVDDFNNRNLSLTAKLLKQGYRYHKIRKAFSKFYHRHSELIVKYNIGLKALLQQGISEPIFYGDLVYKFKRIVGKPIFSDQFKKVVKRYIRVGYDRQSACLV